MPLFDFTGNAVLTSLASSITDTDMSMTLNDPSGYPDGSNGNWTATLAREVDGEEEKVLCGTRTGSAVTIVQRGYDGNVAVAHNVPTTVEHTLSAVFAREVSDHVNTPSRDDHTQYLNNTRHDSPTRHGTSVIADNAVTTAKVADLAITSAKLAADAVIQSKIASGAIGLLAKVGGEVRVIASTALEPTSTQAYLWFDTDDSSWRIWDGAAFKFIDLDLLSDPPRSFHSRSTSQSVSTSGGFLTPKLLSVNTTQYDTDNILEAGTPSSWLPKSPGLYNVKAFVTASQPSGASTAVGWFVRNPGAIEKAYGRVEVNQITGGQLEWSDDFEFDGSTQSVQVGWSHNSGDSQSVTLNGVKIRKVADLV